MDNRAKILLYLVPTALLCFFYLFKSYNFPIHDFSNSYYASKYLVEGGNDTRTLYDIHNFNTYINEVSGKQGMRDFYLNSPYTGFLFAPFSSVEDVKLAKLIFNCVSIILFLHALFLLIKVHWKEDDRYLLFIPIVFFVPIRNHVLFGQSYFVVMASVIYALHFYRSKKLVLSAGFLANVILLKVFPVFYAMPLLIEKKWKALGVGVLVTCLLLMLSVSIIPSSLWVDYLTDIMPTALSNGSTIDFYPNYQSWDVFMNLLFVKDDYYNPNGLYYHSSYYLLGVWLFKVIVFGVAWALSCKLKGNIFQSVSIWILALFLIQTRTPTYSLVLWLVPLISLSSLIRKKWIKLLGLLGVLIICNFSFHRLVDEWLLISMSRLWLTLLIITFIAYSIGPRWQKIGFFLGACLFGTTLISSFKSMAPLQEEYLLDKKEYFMSSDMKEVDGYLHHKVLVRDGFEWVKTDQKTKRFDEACCALENGQIVFEGKAITHELSLKKKPVRIDDCTILFLSDFNARYGAFTLRKINICQ